MSKLILLVAVAAAAWWWWRRHLLQRRSPPPAAAPRAEDMVRCARCGLHLPRSECVARGERSFCSEEHARADG